MKYIIDVTVPYVQSTTFTYEVSASSETEAETIMKSKLEEHGFNSIPESEAVRLCDSVELDDCAPCLDFDIEVRGQNCAMEFKVAPFNEPLSPEVLERHGFKYCPPIPMGQRDPDLAFSSEDVDAFIEYYKGDAQHESKWVLMSSLCTYNDVRDEKTLIKLLELL